MPLEAMTTCTNPHEPGLSPAPFCDARYRETARIVWRARAHLLHGHQLARVYVHPQVHISEAPPPK
eukprot:scaffold94_cov340-Prasinococcus_capsulatus_cf.AAC.14